MNVLGSIMVLCWLKFAVTRNMVEALERYSPFSQFARYSIVRPVLLHGRTKREISTTRELSGEHHLEVTLKVPIDGKEYLLDLQINQDLVPDNHVLSYQENGKTVLHKPKKEEMDLCHYGGSVRGKPASWVAVSTCHGVQGIVFDGERIRYIEPAQEGDINGDHYVYDHEDLSTSRPRRASGGISNSSQYSSYERTARYKRHVSDEEIGIESYQADERSLYMELVLVADKQHYEAHNRSLSSVHKEMKQIANVINSIYSQLNIYIALVGVEVWNDNDKIVLTNSSSALLDNFLEYRRTQLVKNIANDNAQLITHQPFEGDKVGLSYTSSICTLRSSGGIANYFVPITSIFAVTVTHELGHNFGMKHDEEDCECQVDKCIMHDTTNLLMPSRWSSCSLNSLVITFSRGMDNCLRNKPKRLFDSPTCGNGFVEPGEECDCGKKNSQAAYKLCRACCDPKNCTLRANATCGAGQCCDLQTCRPRPEGTKCRSADNECDLPEYCSGDSDHCPLDVYKIDTTPCKGQRGYCVNGKCGSRTDQCRLLWGPSGESCPDWYYNFNLFGSWKGDCGYDRIQDVYKQCDLPDVMCGRLQCSHLSESSKRLNRIEIGTGDDSYTKGARHDNYMIWCYTVFPDLGLDVVDFGIVPDGAKCGKGMMCLNQSCVSVASVRKAFMNSNSSICPFNCSGHGVCNSKGLCHCDRGFTSHTCAQPISSDSEIPSKVLASMYVIFMGVVPAILLILFIVYCKRKNSQEGLRQSSLSTNNNIIEQVPLNANPEINPSFSTIYANVEEIALRRIQNEENNQQ